MGATSESLGLGVDVEYQGVKYTMAPWDLSIQGAFEKYIEGEIVAGARRMASYLPADESSAVLARTAEKIGLKRYTFGTPEIGEALSSPTHMKHMIFLMFKKKSPEITKELVDGMAKDMWSELIQASNRANGIDPNAEASTETENPTKSASAEA